MVDQPVIECRSTNIRVSLGARLGLLGAILFAEKFILDRLVDSRQAQTAQGLGEVVREVQHWGFRYLVTFLAALLVFAFVRTRQPQEARDTIRGLPSVRLSLMLMHVLLVVMLAGVTHLLYRGPVTSPGFAAMAGAWLILGMAAVITAAVGVIPAAIWRREARTVGSGWFYAATVALLAAGAWLGSERLWTAATAITFDLVRLALLPVLPTLAADPATRVLATPHFAVEITQVCSGLEGLGLTLAFTGMWLICFRREYIFPRALILIPLSLLAIFCLNVVRIAALLLIGDAGFPDAAVYGFHSQAGWIAFNAVACAVVFFSRRSAWLNRTASTAATTIENDNPTATYLAPLMAILAAGMLSHALSGRFETLYPLRLLAAVAALWAFRRPLLTIPWRCTWRGPVVGMGMFLLWIGAAHWLLPVMPAPEPLTAMMPLPQAAWIACRCLTAVALVPIAEELAYRGYLMRRLTDARFESVPYRSVRWPALTLTAIAFGAAHGALWFPGIVAGMAYGLLAIRRRSLGEAVAAHATTNALIAVAVLARHQWQFW